MKHNYVVIYSPSKMGFNLFSKTEEVAYIEASSDYDAKQKFKYKYSGEYDTIKSITKGETISGWR